MGWLTHSDEDGVVKQGIGLVAPNVFLSDLFSELRENEETPERVKNRFPGLSQEQYACGLDMIWWLLTSLQYWEELSSVENNGVLDDVESRRLLDGFKKWLKSYDKDPW